MLQLPTLPSAVLKIALDDMELVEKDKRYRIHMGTWHSGRAWGDKCAVCFAGGVMAKTFDCDITATCFPAGFGVWNSQIFLALDYIKSGNVLEFLTLLRVPLSTIKCYCNINDLPTYETNPTLFKKKLREFQSVLESEGL